MQEGRVSQEEAFAQVLQKQLGGSNVMTWGTRTWKFNIDTPNDGLENVSPFNMAILDMFDCRDVNQSYHTISVQEASLMVIDSRSMFLTRQKNI